MSIKQDIQDFYHAKDWYKNSRDVLQELYPDDFRLFAACLAATSPRQSVKGNWTLAKRAYHKMREIEPDFSGFLKAHRNNLETIYGQYHAGYLHQLELSGRKVNAFYHNLIGHPDFVTVDVWMMRYYGYNDSRPTKKIYDEIEKKVKRSAKQYNLFPSELQAILWSAIRHLAGFKPATFLIASIDDYQLTFDFMQ